MEVLGVGCEIGNRRP